MSQSVQEIRDKILEAALPAIPFDGWSLAVLRRASAQAGFQDDMADAVFPSGVRDAVDHFSSWADRQMSARLEGLPDKEHMRVRDKIESAIMMRFAVLCPHKEAVRLAMSSRILSARAGGGARSVWRTADRMWIWAGDTATDYNRYTKRALVVGILLSARLVWLGEADAGMPRTRAFVRRRIENVMRLGGGLSRTLGCAKKVWNKKTKDSPSAA